MISWLYVCHYVIIRQSDGHLVVCMLFCYNKTQSDGHRWKWWEDKIYMWNKLSILIVYKIQTFLVLGVIIHIKLGVICLAHTWVDNDFISHISVTMTMTKINFQKKELILVYGFKGRVPNSSGSMAASYRSSSREVIFQPRAWSKEVTGGCEPSKPALSDICAPEKLCFSTTSSKEQHQLGTKCSHACTYEVHWHPRDQYLKVVLSSANLEHHL